MDDFMDGGTEIQLIFRDEIMSNLLCVFLRGNAQVVMISLTLRESQKQDIYPIFDALIHNSSICSISFASLSDFEFDDEFAAALGLLLKENSSIWACACVAMQLNDAHLAIICSELAQNKTLQHLLLPVNDIGPEGVRVLARLLETNTTLRDISLNSNPILDEGAIVLAALLNENTPLHRLSLDNCQIGEAGVLAIADSLATRNSGL